jgi:hypothetical protein
MKRIIRVIFEWLFLFANPIMFGAILIFINHGIYIIYIFVWLYFWDEGKIFKTIP